MKDINKAEVITAEANTEFAPESKSMTVIGGDVAAVSILEQFKNPTDQFYCSIVSDGSRKSKVAIFNAINNAEKKIADHINEIIEAVNVVAHPVTLVDDETGEVINALRTVIIDKNGVGYEAVSGGIANALSRIMAIVGEPTQGAWEKEPVKMKIKQKATRNGTNKVNTIELV